ncbi:MAG: OmpA family protein [Actinomycetota bacterium]
MNEIDELPAWAGRALQTGSVPKVVVPPQPPPRKRRGGGMLRGFLLGLLGVLLIGGLGAGLFWFLTRDAEEVATEDVTPTTTAADTTETEAEVDAEEQVASPTTTPPTTGTSTPTTETTDTSAGEIIEAGGVPLALPDGYEPTDPRFNERVAANTRYTVVRGGQVFFYGFVPAQEVVDQLVASVTPVFGADNVFSENIVDPAAPLPPDAPVFIDDRVLFAFNSVAIEPAFTPILDLGIAFLGQNPDSQIAIISRTDATGSEEINLEVSRLRADGVARYFTERGVDPARITIEARGEADASESDDETTAALNRSVEFRISGVVGGG